MCEEVVGRDHDRVPVVTLKLIELPLVRDFRKVTPGLGFVSF